MTKEELHDLATPGVRAKVEALERQLAEYYKGWPELFVRAPQVLAVPNGNGKGPWPPVLRAGSLRQGLLAQVQAHRGAGLSIQDLCAANPHWKPDSLRSELAKLAELGQIQRVAKGRYGPTRRRQNAAKGAKGWTPARRAHMAALMRKRHKSGVIARGRAKGARARRQALKALAETTP